jgi:C4-dicarboxylate-binding protein DctP
MSAFRILVFAFCAVLTLNTAKSADILISTENTTDHFQTIFLEDFAKALNNSIREHKFRVVHSAQAFKDRDVAEALSSGRIAIAAPGIWHLGRFAPDLNALLLPSFMGRDSQSVRELVDSDFGDRLNHAIEKNLNVRVIGRWLDVGPAHIFTRETPINHFGDLRGLRIRYAGGEGNALHLKELGAIPVLIPWPNVPEALDRKEIDGLLTTTSTVVSAALWEHGIAHAFLSHSYYPFYMPLISQDIWARLSPNVRDIIQQTWEDMVDEGRKQAIRHQQASLITAAQNNIEIVAPDDAERAQQRHDLLRHQPGFAKTIGISDDALKTLNQIAGEK